MSVLGAAAVALSALGLGNTISNNKQAQENWQKSFNNSKYQYEDMKRYNSMSAQVARMRAAGINPALALGVGQTGTAASSTSSPSSPSFDSVPAGDYMTGLANLGVVDSQNRVANANARGKEIDNMFSEVEHGLKISELMEKIKSLDFGNKKLEFDVEHMFDTWQAQYNNLVADTDYKNAETKMVESQAAINGELLTQAKFTSEHQQELFEHQLDAMDKQAYAAVIQAYAASKSADAALVAASAAADQAKLGYYQFFAGADGMYMPESQRNQYIDTKLDLMKKQVEMYTPEKWSKILAAGAGAIGGAALMFTPLGKGFKALKWLKRTPIGFHP